MKLQKFSTSLQIKERVNFFLRTSPDDSLLESFYAFIYSSCSILRCLSSASEG